MYPVLFPNECDKTRAIATDLQCANTPDMSISHYPSLETCSRLLKPKRIYLF